MMLGCCWISINDSNERSIIAEKYLRDELDWIRSRFSKNERNQYIRAERSGRKFSILPEWRNKILKGLEGWEEKMVQIGVIDYLGLSVKLFEHLDKIEPCHSHILIDEVQDLNSRIENNTKISERRTNDIFMAGDENQKATVKSRSFNSSGINLHSSRKRSIKVNYRNSREILKSAYSIYKNNFSNFHETNEEFEILVPEYANFSSQDPMLIEEIHSKKN